MRVDPRDYGMAATPDGRQGEKLPHRFDKHTMGGVEQAVLTVKDARLGIKNLKGQKRGLLEFAEYPGHAFWLSLACIQTCIQKLGTETERWRGQLVCVNMVRVQNPETEEMVDKYNVSHPDDWAEMIADHQAGEEAHKEAVAAAAKKGKR